MGGPRALLAVLLLTSADLQFVSAAESDGAIEKRKPVPEKVKKAATDYADTIFDAIQVLSKYHIKKVSQEKLVGWAIEGLYTRLGKRIPPEIVKRLLALRNPKEADLMALLIDARQPLGKGKHLDELRDIDLSLAEIFEQLELETKQRPLRESRATCRLFEPHCGIGAEFRNDKASGYLEVVTPIKDGPAYQAGIRAGDRITRIAQEKNEEDNKQSWNISTKGLAIGEAKSKLLGPYKSKVKLTVYREDPSKTREVMVVRNWASKETVFGVRRTATDSWDFLLDYPIKIAYIRLAAFGNNTPRDLAWAMVEVRRRGVTGLLLDLRGNPGGLFDSAIKIVELYINKGLIVTIRERDEEQKVMGDGEGRFSRLPMVCLVDGESAAASEIVAACLQDHRRAVIIGERSRGKAEIQRIIPFHSGSLQFTVAAFYRPSGKLLSKKMTSGKDEDDWGVRPDEGLVVKLSPRERKELAAYWRGVEIIAPAGRSSQSSKPAFRDRQLEKALEHLRNHARRTSP